MRLCVWNAMSGRGRRYFYCGTKRGKEAMTDRKMHIIIIIIINESV